MTRIRKSYLATENKRSNNESEDNNAMRMNNFGDDDDDVIEVFVIISCLKLDLKKYK